MSADTDPDTGPGTDPGIRTLAAASPPAPATDSQLGHPVLRGAGHRAQYPWPLNCPLQAGTSGLVITHGDQPNYTTAFFEAFPRDPNIFLRGEGPDVAAAETHAWQQYLRTQSCAVDNGSGHEFEARGYRNGAGVCRHCGVFGSRVFTGADLGQFCVDCGTPTTYTWVDDDFYCRLHRPFTASDIKTRLWLDAQEAADAAAGRPAPPDLDHDD